jgi:S-formylglutathione hydrolase FrmB
MENPVNRWARTKIAGLSLLLMFSSTASIAQGRIDCSAVNSRILHRSVGYCALLPQSYGGGEGTKYAVLYFLHGLGENEQALIASGGWGLIEDLRDEHQVGDFIVIAPQGGSSFFINSAAGGERYSDFFLSEFLPYIENHYAVVQDRRRRGITGLSMGGYGALRFAFAHPEIFASVSAQSPALITESPAQINQEMRAPGPLARLLATVFGDPINVAHWQENNPFDLARRKPMQLKHEAIYINCGAEDELGFAQGAVKLHQQLIAEGIRHEFHLYPGGHNAEYFLSHLGETIRFHARVFHAAGPRVR